MQQQTADRLHSLAIHLLRMVRGVDEETGLSAPRLSALSVVVFGGPITIGDLAAAEQVTAPTMTKLVQALEQDGFVSRERDPADARVVRVSATAKGTRTLQAGRKRRVDAMDTILANLTPTERRTVDKAISALEKQVASVLAASKK